MVPFETFLLAVAAILAPFFVVGLANIYTFFRCPDCGHVHPQAYAVMALLPFGLVIPGMLIPLIGPPIVIVVMALKPRWLLNFTWNCAYCAEAVPANALFVAA